MANVQVPVGPQLEIEQVDVEQGLEVSDPSAPAGRIIGKVAPPSGSDQVAPPSGSDQVAVPPHWLASKPPAVLTNHTHIFQVFAPSGIGMLHLHGKIVAGGRDHPKRPDVQILPPLIMVVQQISQSVEAITYVDSNNRAVDAETNVESKQQIQIYDAEGTLLHKYKDKYRCYTDNMAGCIMDLLCVPLLWGCANDAKFTAFEEKHHSGAGSFLVIRTPYVKEMYKFITEAVHKCGTLQCCCCGFTGTGIVFDGATLTLYKGSDPASYARSMDFLKAAHLAGYSGGNPVVRSSIKQGAVGDGQWHLWQTTSLGIHSLTCPLRTVSTIPITWPLHFNVKVALNRVSTVIVHELDDQHLALSFDK